MSGLHMGRTWTGHSVEDLCPCPKAPCGLAAPTVDSPECSQHNPADWRNAKTMRQVHQAKDCPA